MSTGTLRKTCPLCFQVFVTGGEFQVRFSSGEVASKEERFQFDDSEGTEVARQLAEIKGNQCNLDHIRYVGEHLWVALQSGSIKAEVKAVRERQQEDTRFIIQLNVPEKLKALPWETLYDRSLGFLACSSDYCIAHDPPPEVSPGAPEPRDGKALRMLVIAPEGTGLDVANEITVLTRECEARKVTWETITQEVTPDTVHTAMEESWDIVHYVGHGRLDPANRLEVQLNDENGRALWMDAETFADEFRNVQLAVMNCCFSAGSSEREDSLNGLGPLLLRRKVRAVVAMRYAVADHMAIRFSQALYHSLFNGPEPGRVDAAIEKARKGLRLNQQTFVRTFVTPVLHLAPGAEHLFRFEAITEKPDDGGKPPPPPPPLRHLVLPDRLQKAIASHNCVPIVGPGILNVGAERFGKPPVGPVDLARALSQKLRPDYPRWQPDHSLCTTAGEWMNCSLLQRVCQHYARQPGGLGDLIKEIVQHYCDVDPPPLLQELAGWEAPALFYTFFDGLLDGCATQGVGRFTHVIDQLDKPRTAEGKRTGRESLLVLVRGSIANAKTLVLTESDHERLAASIVNMQEEYQAIAKEPGRCVLILGSSPRDPLVRQLGFKLLESGPFRQQGPTFFACRDHDAVDDAYWGQFETQWIDDDLEQLIPALTEAVS